MKYLQRNVYISKVILSLFTFLIPSIGMLTGFAVAPLVLVLFIVLAYNVFNVSRLSRFNIKLVFDNPLMTIMILFFCWMLISISWSTNIAASALTIIKIILVFFLGIFLINNTKLLGVYFTTTRTALILGVSTAILLFFIEYWSNGALHKTFYNYYCLYQLDRGCALLSLTSWLVIGMLINMNNSKIAIGFYIAVLLLLIISDSLASCVAFIASGMFVLLARFASVKFLKFISFCLIIGSLSMPIVSYFINPKEISDKAVFLPLTAKLRIFIWHFVAQRSTESAVLGHGFASSKNYKLKSSDIITYDDVVMKSLPLHPHNNVLQILFELGIIGLGLFLTLIYKMTRMLDEITSHDSNFGIISYACFINYYVIGMISYSIWQTWWVYSGIWIAFMLRWMLASGHDNKDRTRYI